MIAIISSVIAGLLQLIGYIIYYKKVLTGSIVPNTASWLIWAIGGILTTSSYIFVSKDIVKDILPIVCSLTVVFIFILCLLRGKFGKIDSFEWVIIILDIGITLYWYFSKDAFITNVLFVLSAFPSFIPIIRAAWKNPENESSLPWVIWSLAYVCMTITVLLRYDKWQDLFYPVALFCLHIIIAALASDFRISYLRAKTLKL